MDTATLIRDALTRDADRYRQLADGLLDNIEDTGNETMLAGIFTRNGATDVVVSLKRARALERLAAQADQLATIDAIAADNLSLETTVGALRDELAREQADHKRTADALLAAQGSDPAGVVMVEQPEQDYAPPFVEATEQATSAAMHIVLDHVAENVRAEEEAAAAAADDVDAAAVTKERRDTPAAQAIANLANRITPKDTK